MVEGIRWSSCGVGWLRLWGSFRSSGADIRYGAVSLGCLNPSTIKRHTLITSPYDLLRVITLHATALTPGSLTYLKSHETGSVQIWDSASHF